MCQFNLFLSRSDLFFHFISFFILTFSFGQIGPLMTLSILF